MFRKLEQLEPVQRLGVGLLCLSAVIALVGFTNQHGGLALGGFLDSLFGDFYANLSAELISIAVTVLIIDRMNRQRDREEQREREREREIEEKKRLIRQMRSKDNALALQAVVELRAKGWHEDGSLRGADLHEADLRGADLSRAVLTGASLTNANLEGCDMERCELQGAMLNGANLRECSLDRTYAEKAFFIEANLVDASLDKAVLTGAHFGLARMQRALMGRANLADADFTEADLSHAYLGAANFNRDMTLPDGSKWTPETDITQFLDPQHEHYWRSANPGSPAYTGEKLRHQPL